MHYHVSSSCFFLSFLSDSSSTRCAPTTYVILNTIIPTTMPASSDAASRRRTTRMRREYIFRKSLEGREKAAYEQKRVIREALASGKPLPTEVRASYDKLRQHIDAEDVATEIPKNHIDNEYGDAGLIEPRVSMRLWQCFQFACESFPLTESKCSAINCDRYV